MHYYQHHIGDFIKATSRLTDSQVMAYLRLIWLYYDKDGVVQNDPEQICFEIGSDVKTIQMIIKTFFEIEGDWLRHSRCDKELQGYLNKSVGGKKGAERRWKNKVSDSLPMGIPMPTQCDPNANQEPITNNQKNNIGVAKATKAKRLDKTELPQDWEDFCKTNRPDLQPQAVFDQFRDYWIAQGGQKGAKLDWFATWRNWVRNQKAVAGSAVSRELPLGTDQQIAHAYQVECGGDPTKARFNSYYEMKKFVLDFRDKQKRGGL